MHQRDASPPPADRGKRRSLFGSRPEPPAPSPLGLSHSAAERAEAVIASYQEMIQEQLDEGLRAIQHAANTLRHDIAAEVWRSAGADTESVGSSILQELSRDQAIRALIAHSDERFQALSARTGRLEDTMNLLAESIRAAREQIERSADALADSSASALGAGQVRGQLDEVTRQVATAFRTLADRDEAIVETVQEQIREHGELISRETARISEAMEAYVQQGVQAMGQLAASADSSVEEFTHREEVISGRVRELVDRQMSELGEQLQLLYDRTAIAATSLHDLVASLGDRMRVESREAGNETREAVLVTTQQMSDATMEAVQDVARSAATAVNRTIEERVTGLAQLGRADSEAIRDELVRRTAVIDDRLAALLDERLGAATHQILEVIDRNMIRMMDGLEANFERLSAQVGDRAATSVDLAIGARFDDVLARLHESAAVIERGSSEVRTVLDVRLSALDERFASLGGRLTALAKLTRSDSEAIANQVLAGQDVTKQALRAMEHLQTSLPAEVIQMVEQRFASIAETIERSNEMLAHRIDRMAESLGRRQNDDIQIVIDRMGDAMHALATLGKGDPRVSAIEID